MYYSFSAPKILFRFFGVSMLDKFGPSVYYYLSVII